MFFHNIQRAERFYLFIHFQTIWELFVTGEEREEIELNQQKPQNLIWEKNRKIIQKNHIKIYSNRRWRFIRCVHRVVAVGNCFGVIGMFLVKLWLVCGNFMAVSNDWLVWWDWGSLTKNDFNEGEPQVRASSGSMMTFQETREKFEFETVIIYFKKRDSRKSLKFQKGGEFKRMKKFLIFLNRISACETFIFVQRFSYKFVFTIFVQSFSCKFVFAIFDSFCKSRHCLWGKNLAVANSNLVSLF